MTQRELFDATNSCGADLSDCRKYRYALWRDWDWQGYANRVMFVGLNPSTADETEDDPTIRRCIGFAKLWGFGGLLMLNAYAIRETDRSKAMNAPDPVGPGNDEAFGYRRTQCGLVVAAWGNDCSDTREREVCQALGGVIHCLGRTKSGRPKHPLYLASNTQREVFWEPSAEQRKFSEHLKEASQIVRSWPAWKQAVLGGGEVE